MLAPYTERWPPNYVEVFRSRAEALAAMREDPRLAVGAKVYYATRPVEFIMHWCVTYDPRNAGSAMPTWMPFILFKRQVELVEFLQACLEADENGLVEKCRDLGATWVCAAFSVWMWLFMPGVAIGWGSRKEQLVDRLGDADSIFEKMRMIVEKLPEEFVPQGLTRDHMTYMRFVNPENGSTITGESGDNIGRGGRKRIYFKDESAHYEHAEMIEAALTDNTRVQIDISSVHGMGTVFHRRREAGVDWEPGRPAAKGKTSVFVMDWRDHPVKDQAWYDERRQKAEAEGLLHVFAQEVERNYSAAVENIIIPADWVTSAIDAHEKLKFTDDGMWQVALDVADEGGDRNAIAQRKGVVLKFVEEWGAKDTGETARKAIQYCEKLGKVTIQYDCVGVGAGVKAESNRLMKDNLLKNVRFIPWDAGSSPQDPDGRVIKGDRDSPLNKDFYANLKAQGWWMLRRRFEKTHVAITQKIKYAPDELISLPSSLPRLRQIQKELSQPTRGYSGRLKMLVEKMPDGTRSPNLGDAIMMCYWPVKSGYDSSMAWVG